MGCQASKSVTPPEKRKPMQNEFEALCKANTKTYLEMLARKIYTEMDVDGTNSISKKELHTIITQLVSDGVTGNALKELTDTFMREMDPNSDGKITF